MKKRIIEMIPCVCMCIAFGAQIVGEMVSRQQDKQEMEDEMKAYIDEQLAKQNQDKESA